MRRRGRSGGKPRWTWALAPVASVLALGMAPAAAAGDVTTATAVVQAQLEFLKQQKVLDKCLEASPTKNTPCIRRNALKLAALSDRHLRTIRSLIDGTERACVLTVARQEIAYLRIWRDGGRALASNERKKARRLFVSSLKIGNAQAKIQPACFAAVFGGA